MNTSEYINAERKEYSLYVLQSRAIPHAADGLKAAARRVLWTARDGKKHKSATLAGATMPIHPHASPEGAVNTLAAPYGNNIPLLSGDGAFGTLLNPTAYGASRYTSVKISEFTKDVVFRDIEIIPMQENYDGTLEEPKHFLPLIPLTLLNPQDGIAVGFASSLLPRSLKTIITAQINYLTKGKITEDFPEMSPLNQKAIDAQETTTGGSIKYLFRGTFEKVNATTIRVTNLPYGISHEKYVTKLDKLDEKGIINDYVDNSRDTYNIEVIFKKGALRGKSDDEIVKLLELENWASENMNVISFDGEAVWSTNFVDLIENFSVWRLSWYKARYERLAGLLEIDIQKYKDIILAINKNVGGLAKKIKSRGELKEVLEAFGIVNIDYIADLPIYRFTEDEKKKVEEKLKAANDQMKEYKSLLASEDKRKEIYVEELKEVLKKYK